MIIKVDTTKKTVLVKGPMNKDNKAILTRLENIGYTVYVQC